MTPDATSLPQATEPKQTTDAPARTIFDDDVFMENLRRAFELCHEIAAAQLSVEKREAA